MGRLVIGAIISVVIGLVITFLVDLIVPTNNLLWALIAVGFASFFASVGGYVNGNDSPT